MNLASVVSKALRAIPTGMHASVTFGRVTVSSYDPRTDSDTGATTEQFTVARAVIVAPNPDTLSDNSLNVAQVRDIIVAAADCAWRPRAEDTVTLPDGTVLGVLSVEVEMPGGTDVMYTVRVKL